MEKAFAIFLGISFALIALFGFSVASATMEGAHVGCVADAFEELQGSACPVAQSPLALLASHLKSLQNFLGNASAGLLAFLTLVLFALAVSFEELAPPLHSPLPVRISIAARPRALAKRIRWTALHESSPTNLA